MKLYQLVLGQKIKQSYDLKALNEFNKSFGAGKGVISEVVIGIESRTIAVKRISKVQLELLNSAGYTVVLK